jgi:diguanylate cyclase (GGDEF)-like protein
MPRPNAASRRLGSLPAKVALAVLLAIALRGLLVGGASVSFARDFFQQIVELTFPAQIERTAARVDAWLAAGHGHVKLLANDPRVLRGSDAARQELEVQLTESGILDALWIVNRDGSVQLIAGEPPPANLPASLSQPGIHALPRDAAPPLPVASARAGRSGWLLGRYSSDGLESLLTGDSLPGVGRGYLLDAQGHVLFGGVRDMDRAPLPLDALLAGGELEAVSYQTDTGAPRIGAARRLDQLSWHVAVVAHLDEGFDPIEPLLLQLFLLDVALIFVMVWITYRVTAGLVRPVVSLAEGARRIAQGDLDVDVQEPRTDDEIGTLTRTFNAMALKLREDQAEIDAAHCQLRDQNQALQAANEVLAQLSITDGLTKLHNHRFFQDHLTRELKRAKRSGDPLSLLLIDIDDFKALNDQHGHAAGDAVLERIGQVMNSAIRESDLLARYGGEEFVVLAATDLEGAVNLAEKLRMQIGHTAIPIDDDVVVFITVSVGVSRYKGDRKAFFRDADRALYAAKAAGKNCVVVDAEPF